MSPQMSCPVACLSCRLSIKRDRMHVLFGGTKLLQSTGDKSTKIRTPDGGCLAVVLRTGFGTAQGGWGWGHIACALPCWAGNISTGTMAVESLQARSRAAS